ncbi:MAG: tol-pal system protein YbgF [Pseudomonadales bacterium]|nr:tol-pal system protein YbgF [Pseudomonadales bacterium]
MQFFLFRNIVLPFTLISSMTLPAMAEVQVLESSSTAHQRELAHQQKTEQAWSAAAKQLFQDIEMLREEVIRLNGQIEEQSFQIDQLKQLQLDNYVDLDKRVAALSVNAVTQPAAPVTAGGEVKVEDKVAYKAAYAFVQQRNFVEAKTAFEAFIQDYPNSGLQANAWFWLGGLHDLAKEYAEAELAYNKVMSNYPEHRKAADAMYKLGEVYYKSDKKVSAKQSMQDLIKTYEGKSSYEKVVRMAREFLGKHFP